MMTDKKTRLALTLREHINEKYDGNQKAFADACGVLPQQVSKWLKMGCIVVDGALFSPRRNIP